MPIVLRVSVQAWDATGQARFWSPRVKRVVDSTRNMWDKMRKRQLFNNSSSSKTPPIRPKSPNHRPKSPHQRSASPSPGEHLLGDLPAIKLPHSPQQQAEAWRDFQCWISPKGAHAEARVIERVQSESRDADWGEESILLAGISPSERSPTPTRSVENRPPTPRSPIIQPTSSNEQHQIIQPTSSNEQPQTNGSPVATRTRRAKTLPVSSHGVAPLSSSKTQLHSVNTAAANAAPSAVPLEVCCVNRGRSLHGIVEARDSFAN